MCEKEIGETKNLKVFTKYIRKIIFISKAFGFTFTNSRFVKRFNSF